MEVGTYLWPYDEKLIQNQNMTYYFKQVFNLSSLYRKVLTIFSPRCEDLKKKKKKKTETG